MLSAVPAVIAAAALVCVGAQLIGQAACWLGGASGRTPLAAPVGLALMMAAALLAPHLPGRTWGALVLILLALSAAVVLHVREPQIRPRASDVLALAPAFALTLVPFLTAGHAGTLGVSFDNDMASHLRIAEAYRSAKVAALTPIDSSYPTGPHALTAVLATVLGQRVDYMFAGVTMAGPIMLGWVALSPLREARWLGRAFVATLVGVPYLVAAFYGEGAFKEIFQAMFVLAFGLGLQALIGGERRARAEGRSGPLLSRWTLRWTPPALLVVGSLAVYSVSGLAWLLAGGTLVLLVSAWRLPTRAAPLGVAKRDLTAAAVPLAAALLVLLVVAAPQIPRLLRFYEKTGGSTGIAVSNLGNLVGSISPWQALGVWKNADFELPTVDPFHTGMLLAFALAVTLFGFAWWWRRGDRAIPAMALVALAIWIYSDHSQSPYVAAKALVVLSPMLLLLAGRPLAEMSVGELRFRWAGALRLGAAAVMAWAVVGSSIHSLRFSFVGSTAHVDELRSIEPLLGGSQTLVLVYDDYIRWELAGTPVSSVVLAGAQQFHERPQKAWSYGQPFDFDFPPSADFEKFIYVITARGVSGSQPPSNFRLVRNGRYYSVWRREGPTLPREVLAEGPEPGALLDCATPQGRALSRRGGEAAVRAPNVDVPVPPLAPGGTVGVHLALTPGRWMLAAPYTSEFSVSVTGAGLQTVLPANLDRPGTRWPIGVVSAGPGGATVQIHVKGSSLALPEQVTQMYALIATPLAPAEVVVPLRRACGRYVDWYRSN